MLKTVAKRLVQLVFAPYQLNRIYVRELDACEEHPPSAFDIRTLSTPEQYATATDPRIRERSWYVARNARGFGVWENDRLVCTCVFWDHRRFFESFTVMVGEGEAALVDLITAEGCRGRGYAPAVIRHAEQALKREGFLRLYSWVWHTNEPSRRTFEKAGWQYVSFVVQATPPGWRRPIRFERIQTGR